MMMLAHQAPIYIHKPGGRGGGAREDVLTLTLGLQEERQSGTFIAAAESLLLVASVLSENHESQSPSVKRGKQKYNRGILVQAN